MIYIPNDDTQNNPFCRLQLVIEMFGHSTLWTNQFDESPKNYLAIESKTLL